MTDRHLSGRRLTRRRQAWAARLEAGEVIPCRLCGNPIRPGEVWDLGHDVDLQLGGNPWDDTVPEHAMIRDCPAGGNRSAGAALAVRIRRAPRRRLGEWLEGPVS